MACLKSRIHRLPRRYRDAVRQSGVMVRAALAPLVRGATYRRGVYLLLGGVVALPYALLALVFTRMLTTPGTPRAATLLLLAVAAVIGVVPAFLRGTRALEIAAARGLLDVDLPDPPASVESARVMRETRLRAALWFTVHLAIGGALRSEEHTSELQSRENLVCRL